MSLLTWGLKRACQRETREPGRRWAIHREVDKYCTHDSYGPWLQFILSPQIYKRDPLFSFCAHEWPTLIRHIRPGNLVMYRDWEHLVSEPVPGRFVPADLIGNSAAAWTVVRTQWKIPWHLLFWAMNTRLISAQHFPTCCLSQAWCLSEKFSMAHGRWAFRWQQNRTDFHLLN